MIVSEGKVPDLSPVEAMLRTRRPAVESSDGAKRVSEEEGRSRYPFDMHTSRRCRLLI